MANHAGKVVMTLLLIAAIAIGFNLYRARKQISDLLGKWGEACDTILSFAKKLEIGDEIGRDQGRDRMQSREMALLRPSSFSELSASSASTSSCSSACVRNTAVGSASSTPIPRAASVLDWQPSSLSGWWHRPAGRGWSRRPR